nr:type II secretion system F family protein [Gammaproteobacteria bacterium]
MAAKAMKESAFTWEGLDRKGTKVKGEIRGKSPAMVKAELRRQGINPRKVRKKSALFSATKGKAITSTDIAIFSRQLATMMSAGVPLVQSFDIVGRGHDNPRMQTMLLSIKNDIEAGNTLADSLGKHPLYFDDLFCNLVRAGEHAGILESLLHKIAAYKERTE